jgi:RNA polymerase sigma factor (sigma-70 family)
MDDLRCLAEQLPSRLRRRDALENECRHDSAVDFADPIDAAERERARQRMRRTLARALRRLSDADRQLIHLRYQQDRTVQALASTLRTTPRILYRRLERARRTLRRAVERQAATGGAESLQ